MTSRILLSILLTGLFVLANGCGTAKNCPVCGTTVHDGYGVIDIIPVPEHNPTGEPGGPFNSFDISLVDSVNHRFYVSDRIGLDVVVTDTVADVALNIITGDNGVAGAGDVPAPCIQDASGNDIIPPLVSALGNYTRFGCRTAPPGIAFPFHVPGFGASTHFGGFPGAQCCAARANGVNPLSAPDGEALTADGKTLFVGNGSSSVAVFALEVPPTPNATGSPVMVADIPTGQSPDYDGCFASPCGPGGSGTGILNPSGIAPCIASANGRAFSDPTCGDLRADEMAYDDKDKVLLVANGDPGLPFVTLIDMSGVVARSGHCLPVDPNQPYGVTYNSSFAVTSMNPPTCILGQIYYDGAGGDPSKGLGLNSSTLVDTVGGTFACPDPSNSFTNGNPVASGVSGTGVAPNGAAWTIPCHHGPILTTSGSFCNQATPAAGCAGALALAGIGGSAFNPNTGHFLVTNSNATGNLTVGTVDEIDPRLTDTSCGGISCGPVVVNSFLMPNCMPTSVVQGPGNNFLVGCADHDGEAFPPNEYVIDGATGAIKATITQVGGVDEIWYNPGDNRYYVAARDMPNGPVLGVIDAKTNRWLQNVTTNSNSHSVSVDSGNNHVFVPLQSGGICTSQSSNGCIGVYAQQ